MRMFMKFYTCILQLYVYMYTFFQNLLGNIEKVFSLKKNKGLYGTRPLLALFDIVHPYLLYQQLATITFLPPWEITHNKSVPLYHSQYTLNYSKIPQYKVYEKNSSEALDYARYHFYIQKQYMCK